MDDQLDENNQKTLRGGHARYVIQRIILTIIMSTFFARSDNFATRRPALKVQHCCSLFTKNIRCLHSQSN